MNKSVLWLIKTYSVFFFLTFSLPLPSLLLRPTPHVSDYFWIRKFSLRIQKLPCPHVAYSNQICLSTRILDSLSVEFISKGSDWQRTSWKIVTPPPPPTHTQGSNSCPELFLNEVIQELDYVRLSYVRKFRGKISVKWYWYFLAPKTGTGLSCTIYKIPLNFSLSLDMKPVSSNPEKWYRKLRSFRQKREKVIPRKVLLFSRKISTGMNRSIWLLPRISGFSIQTVSAVRLPTGTEYAVGERLQIK